MYSEKQRRITTFMKTPRELEKVKDLVSNNVGMRIKCMPPDPTGSP